MANNVRDTDILAIILRHDAKLTSYKIALLRALNDVVLAYPDLAATREPIAVPIRNLAQFWIAYYWPFCDRDAPILQGRRAFRDGVLRKDLGFRTSLEELRAAWEQLLGERSRPSDGFFLLNEIRLPRKSGAYRKLLPYYERAIKRISEAIHDPLQYAGPGNWTVFPKPARYSTLQDVRHVPGTKPQDVCLLVSADLWSVFTRMSLWVEALSIHEWCMFTETITQHGDSQLDRGHVYRLLTDRPDNRRPLTWERNNIDLLLMEGFEFICPWTQLHIHEGTRYDLDHLVPVSIYPINEMWNLVPTDPYFNERVKRDRLPSAGVLSRAKPALLRTYSNYASSTRLSEVIRSDAAVRFSTVETNEPTEEFTASLAGAVVSFIDQLAAARSLLRFG